MCNPLVVFARNVDGNFLDLVDSLSKEEGGAGGSGGGNGGVRERGGG